MKLGSPQASTPLTGLASSPGGSGNRPAVLRVDAAAACADRERSLQEEAATIEPEAIAEFAGEERQADSARRDADEIASDLRQLGEKAEVLLKPRRLRGLYQPLDTEA